ncbi:outer membrane beta-barrel protein [Aquimarina agarilytica]|uniref:outer membrane beta-barrel protein n=1 Tax=Aquimarina agarilytica TaxID=1087449 RepID=UPI0002892744|nr:outer membrane beta-barrel protein [Aquimarina agarilytica]
MKKIVLTLILSACGFVLATAQGKPSFGLKAGLNFVQFDARDDVEVDNNSGFHAGIVLHVPLIKKSGLQFEALYSVESSDDIDLNFINVPILYTHKLLPGLRLQVGPQFKISTKSEFKDEVVAATFEEDFKSFNFDLSAGLEYKLPAIGVFAQARYNYGLTEFEENFELKSNTFQLSVGYRF